MTLNLVTVGECEGLADNVARSVGAIESVGAKEIVGEADGKTYGVGTSVGTTVGRG